MSAKKNKRKKLNHNHPSTKINKHESLLSRYPRLLLVTGSILVIVSILLLTIGYVSDARVGMSMISLFFGVGCIIFSNSATSKSRRVKRLKS